MHEGQLRITESYSIDVTASLQGEIELERWESTIRLLGMGSGDIGEQIYWKNATGNCKSDWLLLIYLPALCLFDWPL